MVTRFAALLLLLSGCARFAAAQTACPPPQIPPLTAAQNIFSPSQEVALGDVARRQIGGGALEPIDDAALQANLDRILARLTAPLPSLGFPIQVHLLAADYANAFTFPGGQIYITRPLIGFLQSEAEVAGVLSHELGHTYARQLPREFTEKLALIGVTQLGGGDDVQRQYNRLVTWEERHTIPASTQANQIEEQADALGLQIMALAGYDPEALPAAFDRFSGQDRHPGNWLTHFIDNDPDSQRLRAMIKGQQQLLRACQPAPVPPAVSDFAQWQAAIAAYQRPAGPALLPPGTQAQALPPLTGSFRQIRFSPDGRYLFAQDAGGAWVLSRSPLAALFHVDEPEIADLRFTADSSAIVFATRDMRVERWSLATRSRTLLRQVIPAMSVCAKTEVNATGDRMLCLRSDLTLQVLNVATGAVVLQAPGVLAMATSPDGNFVLVTGGHGVLATFANGVYSASTAISTHNRAFDLRSGDPIKLNDRLQDQINLTFVGGDEVLGTGDTEHQHTWVRSKFPGGEPVEKLKMGITTVAAAAHGGVLIARPLAGQAAGIYDPTANQALYLSPTPGLDAFDDTFAAEDNQGAVVLLGAAGGKIETTARLRLPVAPLADLSAAALSPDGAWLMISEASHGVIWNLGPNPQPRFLPGFENGWFPDANHAWVSLLPDQKAIDDAAYQKKTAPATPSLIDLSAGSAHLLTPRASHRGQLFAGAEAFTVDTNLPQTPVMLPVGFVPDGTVTLRDTRDDRALWQRSFHFSNYADCFPAAGFLPGGGAALLFDANCTPVRQEARGDTAGLQALNALDGPTRAAAIWAELLDRKTGQRQAGVLLSPAPRLLAPALDRFGDGAAWQGPTVFQIGGDLYLSDVANRVLAYPLAGGQPAQILFGAVIAASSACRCFLLSPRPRQLDFYAPGTGRPQGHWSFPDAVVFAQFTADGKTAVVVTRDQTLYRIPVG